jgi:hypothetical protein
MLNIQIELNIVKKSLFCLLFRLKYFILVEIFLDEKSAANIEIAEDALGDEVYYNYLKMGRKLVDENELDEERV